MKRACSIWKTIDHANKKIRKDIGGPRRAENGDGTDGGPAQDARASNSGCDASASAMRDDIVAK